MSIVDARAAGEGNLEILVQVGDQSLPTDVQPLGNAIFGVSFDALNDSPQGATKNREEREFATKEELFFNAHAWFRPTLGYGQTIFLNRIPIRVTFFLLQKSF